MRKVVILIMALVVCGCTTAPSGRYTRGAAYRTKSAHGKGDFIELEKLCRRHKLDYSFDTLDDMLIITSSDIDMKLLLASSLAYYNGNVLSIKDRPFYSNGKIFVPKELENIISSKPKKAEILRFLPLSLRTIVIDPGHGGKDPGAISNNGLREKGINLKVARYLKEELNAQGFRVYLTRDRDKYLTLQQRVEVAKYHNADLFISIHANANRSRKVKGLEIYYLSEKYLNDQAKDVVKYEDTSLRVNNRNHSRSAKGAVLDLIRSENTMRSVEFANTLARTLKRMGLNIKSPKGAPFYVLKNAYVPSVLVEIGYLTNAYEEKLIKKSHYQKQIAQGIALSVNRLNKYYARASR